MNKPWLKEYPEGVSAEIDLGAYHSVVDLFETSCQAYASRPAYLNMGVSMTYQALDQYSKHFAAYLQTELQLSKGDRLAIMMPNVLQYPVVLFGAMRAGITIVNVNPLYTPRELAHQLTDSGATAIVLLSNFAHTLEACLDQTPIKHIILTEIGDLFPSFKRVLVNSVVKYVKKMVPSFHLPQALKINDVLAKGKSFVFHPTPIEPSDIAFLQYTGGTTGVSKGAILTHQNMLANMQQADAWVNLVPGEEVIVTALPLYHIFSLTANCLVYMRGGGCNLLITNPRDIPLFIKTLKKHPFTAMTGVNTLFNALAHHPDIHSVDFSSLTLTLGGGMAVQKHVADRWKEITGCTLVEAYGLTETSPAVCINPLDLKSYNGAIGLPLPSTDVMILDEHGNPCPVDMPGELCVKGPQVMQGYWQRPDETKKVFTQDGWLKTGDIATMDEKGYVRLVSRKKDMILVSGFNVYPNEIEDVVSQHDSVLEVAAVGIPDDKSGERVKLFIVKDHEALNESDIFDYCKDHLTDYKQPVAIEFRKELPKTNVGKILHRALREESQQSFAQTLQHQLEESSNHVKEES